MLNLTHEPYQYVSLLNNAMATHVDAGRATTLADAAPFIDISDVRRQMVPEALADAAAHLDDEPDPHDDADNDQSGTGADVATVGPELAIPS